MIATLALAASLVVQAREAVQAIVPPAPAPAVRCADVATRLIVRWEITSEAVYTRRYQGVIWPGGASGPTWGVGYDGGHQTRSVIRMDWRAHPAVERLADSSGLTGTAARDALPNFQGIRTPYALAHQTFAASTLPTYYHATRRALGAEFERLPCGAVGALVSVGYNRGWQMAGSRRTELRVIRDVCVPALDVQCIGREIRAMNRLWPNVPGLQARRNDEARSAIGGTP